MRGAPVRQKLDMISENKVVQKLKLDFFLQKMVSLIDILKRTFFRKNSVNF